MKLTLTAVLVSSLAMSGLALAQDKDKAPKKKSDAAKSVTVRLSEQNKSGESGTAKLTAAGADKTKVEISVKGAPKGVSQPAHIHDGTCAKLDPKPKYGLQNVVDGKSTSEVAADLKTLTSGKLAINVHKSAEEVKTYVACGDIKGASATKKAEPKKDK
ncbi:MAG TPA: CHRD domain-containing protein [Burkholderiales bacterium]|nr:CHRD domain-containing protein [Burkholderiales bacterium]